MSETETTGATDTGSAETSGSSVPSNSNTQAVKERAFAEMAKADDSTDYIAERRDQEAEARGDEKVEQPHRKQERLERFRRALDRARQEGEPAAISEANASDHVPAEASADRDKAIEHARLDAQFELRANEFISRNPDFVSTVQETFALFPAGEHFKEAVLQSPLGPEILYEFARNPEAIEEINRLPPHVAARYIGVIEGRLAHERAAGRQPQARVTKAPPPMRQVGGGAAPPAASLHSLAKKDNAGDYIRERNRQERARAGR
jgi:hypothetical protein